MHITTLSTRQLRARKLINCLMGAYPYGGSNVRDIASVTSIPEPRVSEIVSELEASGELRTYRDGKSRMITLADHPVAYLDRYQIAM